MDYEITWIDVFRDYDQVLVISGLQQSSLTVAGFPLFCFMRSLNPRAVKPVIGTRELRTNSQMSPKY